MVDIVDVHRTGCQRTLKPMIHGPTCRIQFCWMMFDQTKSDKSFLIHGQTKADGILSER